MSNIEELRSEIDVIDKELIGLFEKRMRVVKQIGEYKKANNIPVFDSAREEHVLKTRLENAAEDLKVFDEVFFTSIFMMSKEYQSGL